MGLEILLIAIVTAISCSILGTFLILRKMSMMTDAISHTILLGIVLVFLIVPDLNSPLLILGAVGMGLVTVFLTEGLVKTNRINEDAATGVVFPLLFSIAIIIISLFINNIHMDIDAVLLGKLELSSIDQLYLFGVRMGPVNLYIALAVLIINILFIKIFYKELKIVSFDSALAAVLGFSPIIIHYLLMGLVSLTAVTSFSSVGSILVVSLMIGPGITAMQFTKDLKWAILWAALIAIFNSIIGYILAIILNVTTAGLISTVTLVTFLIVLFFNPKNGILFKAIRKQKQKGEFTFLVLLMHMYNNSIHESNKAFDLEIITKELNWSVGKTEKFINDGINLGYIIDENDNIKITEDGIKYHHKKLIELSN